MCNDVRRARAERLWIRLLLSGRYALVNGWRVLLLLMGLVGTILLERYIWGVGSRAVGNRLIIMFFALYPLGVLTFVMLFTWRTYDAVCNAWLSKTKDQGVLLLAARCGGKGAIRCAAVARLDDQTHLIGFAQADEDANVRCEAIKRVTDEETLQRAARLDTHPGVRREAVQRVASEQVKIEAAMTDDALSVKRAALLCIRDEGALRNIACAPWFADALDEQVTERLTVRVLHALLEAAQGESMRLRLLCRLMRHLITEPLPHETRALIEREARALGEWERAVYCPHCGGRETIRQNSHVESECVYSSADSTLYEDTVVYDEGFRCEACGHAEKQPFAADVEKLMQLYA